MNTLYQRRVGIPLARTLAEFRQADVSVFHEFVSPPIGGGHQFMRALWTEFIQRGIKLENNTISHTTRACIFNSYNFDFERLRKLRRSDCWMVHRVDGPMVAYRGRDDGSDKKIWQLNRELANSTIFQSHYSLQKHLELGMEFKSPIVIMNAADLQIFHPNGRIAFDRHRKTRLISNSWSNNLNKGALTYKWIEDHLDWDRFEYTFVGSSPIEFDRIQMVPPVKPESMASLLRQHDIYIAGSRHDPCSNSLIEALSCGLPAIYLKSGGHPEIVAEAGFGFSKEEKIPDMLDQLVEEYEYRQSRISLPTISVIADRYLDVMGIKS